MKRLLGSLLFLCSFVTYAEDAQLSLDVNVKDPSFVLMLPANPTTGFVWTVEQFDKNLLALSSSLYEKPKTQLIGAGGQMKFTFNLNKGKVFPANTQIVFKYGRSWEPKTAITKTVTVHFVTN